MSADNWAICPKCNQKQQKELEKLSNKVQSSYGQITMEAWLELKSKLDNPLIPDFTLREDYEIGIKEGEFSVKYSGRCRICGFFYEYKHTEQIS